VTTEPRLREHDLGDWEGEPWLELPPDEREAYIADLDFAPPGGETNREVLARVTEFREEIRGAHAGEAVLIVSHGGPLFALMHDVLELPWTPRQRFYPTNGGISEFAWQNGGWRLLTFDETHHLRGLP
jgi:broad specificity phosphatase PhoE